MDGPPVEKGEVGLVKIDPGLISTSSTQRPACKPDTWGTAQFPQTNSWAIRREQLFVKRLEFGYHFLGVGRGDLEEASAATPSSGYDDHLDVGGLTCSGFDDGGRLILRTGLQFVFARRDVNGEPPPIGEAIRLLAVEVDRWLECGAGEVALAEEHNGGIGGGLAGVNDEFGFDGGRRCSGIGGCGLLLRSCVNSDEE